MRATVDCRAPARSAVSLSLEHKRVCDSLVRENSKMRIQTELQIVQPGGHLFAHSRGGAAACRRKFLRIFPKGFADANYLAWERNYKWEAHRRWDGLLNKTEIEKLHQHRDYAEIAKRAIQIESRTNLLFSFEKMALRDAVRETSGARMFADGLYNYLFGHAEGSSNANRRDKAFQANTEKLLPACVSKQFAFSSKS
jgi:hypothetical protein